MPSNAERAAVLAQGVVASVTGDSSVISQLYTKDVEGWSPVMHVSSAAELAGEFEDRVGVFSDIEFEATPLDVCGDSACVEWEATATHSGPVLVDEDVVVEPTGLRFRLRGVTVAEFDGDRIRSFRQYWDEVSLIKQLGLLRED